MTNYNILKSKADTLFWVFEENYFKNTGNYPRRTNLVLEFADFIKYASKADLEQYVHFNNEEEYLSLKRMVNQGIDAWLDAGQIKTLFL